MKQFVFLLSIIFLIATAGSCKKKPCDDVNCNSGGDCVSGTCQCDTLHEGTYCETEKRARYFGSFVGEINCPSSTQLDYVSITAVSDSLNLVNFHNLFGEEQNIRGIITNNGSIYIPSQNSGNNTISGTATIVNEKIVVDFTVTNAGVTQNCSWTEKW
jgi:hypothetical protein